MKNMTLMTIALAAASLFASCKDDVEMKYPQSMNCPTCRSLKAYTRM